MGPVVERGQIRIGQAPVREDRGQHPGEVLRRAHAGVHGVQERHVLGHVTGDRDAVLGGGCKDGVEDLGGQARVHLDEVIPVGGLLG